jgi:glycosyltransferase involved in cell wall biosynthesis
MPENENPLISVITPCYNSAKYIAQTIESVLSQTYQNWEMIIVDDCSTDNSHQIALGFAEKDKRIRLYQLEQNSGVALARNRAIMESCGKYIAFLDSDDLWLPNKLENQIKLFDNNDIKIVYSNYEKLSETGIRSNRVIKAPSSVTYLELLKSNCIGCLTAIYDVSKTGKVYFEQFHHEDYILWLTILCSGCIARNTDTTEALYRVKKRSLSANKFIVLSWQWNIYRKFLKLPLFQSIYYFFFYAINAFSKYIK